MKETKKRAGCRFITIDGTDSNLYEKKWLPAGFYGPDLWNFLNVCLYLSHITHTNAFAS